MESDPLKPIEIKPDQPGPAAEWFGWALLFVAVSASLVFMLLWLTESILMAVGMTTFMMIAMVGMGWLASRNLDGRR